MKTIRRGIPNLWAHGEFLPSSTSVRFLIEGDQDAKYFSLGVCIYHVAMRAPALRKKQGPLRDKYQELSRIFMNFPEGKKKVCILSGRRQQHEPQSSSILEFIYSSLPASTLFIVAIVLLPLSPLDLLQHAFQGSRHPYPRRQVEQREGRKNEP